MNIEYRECCELPCPVRYKIKHRALSEEVIENLFFIQDVEMQAAVLAYTIEISLPKQFLS